MTTRKGNDVFTGGTDGAPEGSMAQGWAGERKDVLRDEFGLEIPVEDIPLPSKGLVYPPSSPLHMKETVQIRAMTAREEDILTSRALIKNGTVISELIRSCLVDKRIDPDDMLLGDRNALMVALRITGYGSSYPTEMTCPACNEKGKFEFNLSELPLKFLEQEPVAQGSNVFEAKVDDNMTIRFKYMTGHEEKEMSKAAERKKKQGFQSDNLITTRYQYQVLAVNNITDKTKIQMFVQKMPTKISRNLRKVMDSGEPGIDMKQHVTCPSCSEESEVSMPLGASFFWPDAG